jgi:hypothetical protein
VAGDDINAPVNTGTFTGVQADGPVTNSVVGNDNQTVQNTGNAQDAVFNFGAGSNIVDVSDSPGATTALGGDATNQVGNVVGPGGALSGSGDATGHFEDNDQDNDTTITDNSQDNDATYQDSFNTSSASSVEGDASAESGSGDQDSSEDNDGGAV